MTSPKFFNCSKCKKDHVIYGDLKKKLCIGCDEND